jgi:Na+-transporting NADH:ubiquinone oxidoreductase subunit NqrF
MFSNVKKAYYTEIRTSANISVKLNSTDNAAIVINSADSPYIIDQIAVKNIYISNSSGGGATVNLLCV